MTHIPVLEELAIIAVLGVAVTALLARLRLPTVAGLLAAGALVGPFGLGLVTNVHAIEVLAEVGVVLLLFTIGLEFSVGGEIKTPNISADRSSAAGSIPTAKPKRVDTSARSPGAVGSSP
jgi:predicted Kef-type K+ transport protein